MKSLYNISALMLFLLGFTSQSKAQLSTTIYKINSNASITIDGIGNETFWKNVKEHTEVNYVNASPNGEKDFKRYWWKAAWNDTAIFFLVKVEDDFVFPYDHWAADGIDFYFRFGGKEILDPHIFFYQDSGVYQIPCMLTERGYLHGTYQADTSNYKTQSQLISTPEHQGYYIETYVLWDYFVEYNAATQNTSDVIPEDGYSFEFDINTHDNDTDPNDSDFPAFDELVSAFWSSNKHLWESDWSNVGTITLHSSQTSIIDMDISNRAVCPGVKIIFKASPDSFNYEWNFGDGTSIKKQNHSHVYDSCGTYPVSLHVTNESGLDTILYDTVSVSNSAPIQNAKITSIYNNYKCPGETVEVKASSDNNTRYVWNLGDGTFSYSKTAEHVYSSAGEFPVSLKIINLCGQDTIIYDTVNVVDTIPVRSVKFGFFSDSICPGEYVSFWVNSSRSNSLIWNFGDGNTSRNDHTWHKYESPGTYPISLTITNLCNNDTTLYDTVNIVDSIPIKNATFTIQNPYRCPGEIIHFNGNKNNVWDLGDGTTSNYEDYSHIYNETGTYIVSNTMRNGCGYDTTLYDTIFIVDTLQVSNTTIVKYSSYCPGAPIKFKPSTGYKSYQYQWDFADGYTSYHTTTTHSYKETGTYIVSLNITNACGNETTIYDTVYITDTVPVYQPKLLYSKQKVCPNDTVYFYTLPEDQKAYEWDFGDGITRNPQYNYTKHAYSMPGTYEISLTVTNNCGNNSIVSDTIYVENHVPVIEHIKMSISDRYLCPHDKVDFSTNAFSLDHVWNFGDGNKTSSRRVSHLYDSSGSFPVTLTVSNSCGMDTTLYSTIVVDNNLNNFPNHNLYTKNAHNICPGDSISLFIPNYYKYDNYTFTADFGDGTSSYPTEIENSNMDIFKHAYTNTGDYLVTLTTTNNCGLSRVDSFVYYDNALTFHVKEDSPPHFGYPGIDADPYRANIYDTIVYTIPNDYAYGEWDFGDHSPIVEVDKNNKYVEHQYSHPGKYIVSATLSNSCGFTKTLYETVEIDTVYLSSKNELKAENKDILLYPNPSNDGLFNLKINTPENNDEFSVEIMNISGKTIYIEPNKMVNVTHQLDLSDQPSGMYFVKVKGTQSTVVKKVIIR